MKILLVDDHTLFREGLRLLLERLGEPFEVLEAGDCVGAFAMASAHPDLALVLLDLGLPDMPGSNALGQMRERFPGLPVVVLSGRDDRPAVLDAINRGAMGIIPKSSDSNWLVSAWRLVMAKGVYVPPGALTHSFSADDPAPNINVNRKSASLRALNVMNRTQAVLAVGRLRYTFWAPPHE
jgi:DNA-binding NarL/FixJ family response regulator